MSSIFSVSGLFPPPPPTPAFFSPDCLLVRKETWNLRLENPDAPEEMEVIQFSEAGTVLSRVVKDGKTGKVQSKEVFAYDEHHHVKTATYWSIGVSGALEQKAEDGWSWETKEAAFWRYRNGQLVEKWQRNEDQSWTKTFLDKKGNATGTEKINDTGSILESNDYASGQMITNVYDAKGALLRIDLFDSNSELGEGGQSTQYRNVYNDAGRIAEQWSGPHLVRRFLYNDTGRLVEEGSFRGADRQVRAIRYYCE